MKTYLPIVYGGTLLGGVTIVLNRHLLNFAVQNGMLKHNLKTPNIVSLQLMWRLRPMDRT